MAAAFTSWPQALDQMHTRKKRRADQVGSIMESPLCHGVPLSLSLMEFPSLSYGAPISLMEFPLPSLSWSAPSPLSHGVPLCLSPMEFPSLSWELPSLT